MTDSRKPDDFDATEHVSEGSKRLGSYVLRRKIGEGGMGEVYLAKDLRLDRDVAIKVLSPRALGDRAARRRFRKEALALSSLNHPHVATIHDFDSEDGVDFLVMEYVPGQSLADRVKQGPMSEAEVVDLAIELAEGLAAAHDENLIHRDLKPGNLKVRPDGHLKILDFGLAQLVRPISEDDVTVTMTSPAGSLIGTVPYMAPEQLRGEPIDPRTDLYAVGVVLYELVTGQRPDAGAEGAQLIASILDSTAPPPSSLNVALSRDLEAVILTLLEKDPSHRYQTARELQSDLEDLRSGLRVRRARRERRRRRSLIAAAAVIGLAALAFLADVAGIRGRFTPGTSIGSLAVLPVKNLSGDPEQDVLAEAMTDDIITRLSGLSGLEWVPGLRTVMQFADSRETHQEIARELDVDAVLEASLRQVEGRIKVNVQLVDGRTNRSVWGRPFERNLAEAMILQTELVRSLAQAIHLTLTLEEESLLTAPGSVDPELQRAWNLARHHWRKNVPQGWEKSMEYLQEVLRLDSRHAPAHALLADCYTSFSFFTGDYALLLSGDMSLPAAKAAAETALEIDPNLSDAHMAMATVDFLNWEWDSADRHYRRAILLDPSNAHALVIYSRYLWLMQRYDEALEAAQRAADIEPLWMNAHQAVFNALYFGGRLEEALEKKLEFLELLKEFPDAAVEAGAYRSLAFIYADLGRYEEALAVLDEHHDEYFARATVYWAMGDLEKARETIGDHLEESKGTVAGVDIAIVAGEIDLALEELERGFQRRDPGMVWIRKLGDFYPELAASPRYHDLLARMDFLPE